MELWHGSPEIVRTPLRELCRPCNDYGPGFYCTPHAELAREWACPQRGKDGIANRYELDLGGLGILDLEAEGCSVLTWLAVLVSNRPVQVSSPIARDGMEYLRRVFGIDLEPYDVVRGCRADDSYFSFVRAFLNNTLSVAQVGRAMRLGGLGSQVMVRSELAFGRLCFRGYETVPACEYYPLRMRRDASARRAFQDERTAADLDGLYIRDILREEVGPDDPRIR